MKKLLLAVTGLLLITSRVEKEIKRGEPFYAYGAVKGKILSVKKDDYYDSINCLVDTSGDKKSDIKTQNSTRDRNILNGNTLNIGDSVTVQLKNRWFVYWWEVVRIYR